MSRASTSSGVLAASAGATVIPTAVYTSGLSSGKVWSITLVPAAAESIITIYDNRLGDTSGTVLARVKAVANGESVTVNFDTPPAFNQGLSYALTGASATAIVNYELGG